MCSPTIIIIYILDIRGTVGACPSSHFFLVPPQAEHSILQYVHGIFEREKGENRKEDDEAGYSASARIYPTPLTIIPNPISFVLSIKRKYR